MSQINRCDDLFPSLLLFFFHCVNQLVSSLHGSFGKRVAWVLFLVCFIYSLWLFRETRYVVCPTPPWYVPSGHYTYKTYESIVVFWDRFNFFDGFIKIRWEIVPFRFPQVKASSEWSRLWHNNWVDSHTGRCGVREIWSRTDFSHISKMFEDINRWGPGCIPSSILHCWMISAVSRWGWVTICLNLTIARPLPRRYPLWCIPRGYCGCWNLLLRYEAWFFCPSGGSRNGSGGGLYRECTTTPGSSTVMNSTFSSSHTEMLFTFRPSLTKTELPCLLCGHSATSVIPGIFGLAWSLARCVSWRHRQWQCCILHNSDSIDALLATFADITVIAPEGLWLCTADMVWGIIHKFDVLEELVNNLTRWIGLVVLQGSRQARFFHDPQGLIIAHKQIFPLDEAGEVDAEVKNDSW